MDASKKRSRNYTISGKKKHSVGELAIGKIGCFSYFKRNEPRLTAGTVFLKFNLKASKIMRPPIPFLRSNIWKNLALHSG
jgi:hypothetical protein